MKKTNKLLLSIGALGAIATPVVAVISCGHHTAKQTGHVVSAEETQFWGSWLTGAETTLVKPAGMSQYSQLPKDYEIPSTVQVISGAFSGMTLPEGFIIPSTVRVIDKDSFANAILPEGFEIPSTVELIKTDAFDGATLPVGFSIPSNVKVEEGAFDAVKLPHDTKWIAPDGEVYSSTSRTAGGWRVVSPSKIKSIESQYKKKAEEILATFDESKISGFDKTKESSQQAYTSEDDQVILHVDSRDGYVIVRASAEYNGVWAEKTFNINGFQTIGQHIDSDQAMADQISSSLTEADIKGIKKNYYADDLVQIPYVDSGRFDREARIDITKREVVNNELHLTIHTNYGMGGAFKDMVISGFAPLPDAFWAPWLQFEGRIISKPADFKGTTIPAEELAKFPQTVNRITPNTFDGITLGSFSMPSELKYINNGAFANATLPEGFAVPTDVEVGTNAFAEATFLGDFTVHENTAKADMFTNSHFRKNLIIASDVTRIKTKTFEEIEVDGVVNFSQSLHTIDNEAFLNATLQDNFEIPGWVTTLGPTAFKGTLSHHTDGLHWINPNGKEGSEYNDPDQSIRLMPGSRLINPEKEARRIAATFDNSQLVISGLKGFNENGAQSLTSSNPKVSVFATFQNGAIDLVKRVTVLGNQYDFDFSYSELALAIKDAYDNNKIQDVAGLHDVYSEWHRWSSIQ